MTAVRKFFEENEGSSVRCACDALAVLWNRVVHSQEKVVLEGVQVTVGSIPHRRSRGIKASGL